MRVKKRIIFSLEGDKPDFSLAFHAPCTEELRVLELSEEDEERRQNRKRKFTFQPKKRNRIKKMRSSFFWGTK